MKKKKYGILVDTGSGNDLSFYENTDIEAIPLHIIFEDGTDIKDTQENVKKNNFYQRVKDGENTRTSQASPGELLEKYEEMLEKYEHIIHLPIAKNLSSMYQTAVVVSKEFPDKITVVEHSMAANGLKDCAIELNRQLDMDPKMDLDGVHRFLKEYEKGMYLGLMPGDLRKFDKGGRGSSTLKSMLNLLKIKVLIQWGEPPKKESIGRTITSVMETAASHVNDYHGERYKAMFITTPMTDKKYVKLAKEVLEKKKVDYVEEDMPSLYVAHAGVNSVALIFVKIIEGGFES